MVRLLAFRKRLLRYDGKEDKECKSDNQDIRLLEKKLDGIINETMRDIVPRYDMSFVAKLSDFIVNGIGKVKAFIGKETDMEVDDDLLSAILEKYCEKNWDLGESSNDTEAPPFIQRVDLNNIVDLKEGMPSIFSFFLGFFIEIWVMDAEADISTEYLEGISRSIKPLEQKLKTYVQSEKERQSTDDSDLKAKEKLLIKLDEWRCNGAKNLYSVISAINQLFLFVKSITGDKILLDCGVDYEVEEYVVSMGYGTAKIKVPEFIQPVIAGIQIQIARKEGTMSSYFGTNEHKRKWNVLVPKNGWMDKMENSTDILKALDYLQYDREGDNTIRHLIKPSMSCEDYVDDSDKHGLEEYFTLCFQCIYQIHSEDINVLLNRMYYEGIDGEELLDKINKMRWSKLEAEYVFEKMFGLELLLTEEKVLKDFINKHVNDFNSGSKEDVSNYKRLIKRSNVDDIQFSEKKWVECLLDLCEDIADVLRAIDHSRGVFFRIYCAKKELSMELEKIFSESISEKDEEINRDSDVDKDIRSYLERSIEQKKKIEKANTDIEMAERIAKNHMAEKEMCNRMLIESQSIYSEILTEILNSGKVTAHYENLTAKSITGIAKNWMKKKDAYSMEILVFLWRHSTFNYRTHRLSVDMK